MFSFLKKILFLMFFSINIFATLDFTNPTETPTGVPPNLADNNGDNFEDSQKVAADSTGQNVYAIWSRTDGTVNRIQVAISHDFGDTWLNPTSTPALDGSPNLSEPRIQASDGMATNPQITTDGRHVYAIWERMAETVDGVFNQIQVAVSYDFGENWIYPDTPAGSSNLSQPRTLNFFDGDASRPQITAAEDGYVYAVWERIDLSGDSRIQVARSFSFGDSWEYPTSTPASDGFPNLSEGGQSARDAQITTDSIGEHVYAIWSRNDGTVYRIQVAISSDHGETWVDPTSTPASDGFPNLSQPQTPGFPDGEAGWSHIATSSSGEHVYAIWQRSDETAGNQSVQVAVSHDFGANWIDPISTPSTIPNISIDGRRAAGSKIATNSSGQYVYAIWITLFPLAPEVDQRVYVDVAISSNYGNSWTYPTSTPTGASPHLAGPNVFLEEDIKLPSILTDSSGQKCFAIWQTLTSSGFEQIQAASSSNYGTAWVNPTSTPPGTTSPNISLEGESSFAPDMAISSNGQYVYGVWFRENTGYQEVNGFFLLKRVSFPASISPIR